MIDLVHLQPYLHDLVLKNYYQKKKSPADEKKKFMHDKSVYKTMMIIRLITRVLRM